MAKKSVWRILSALLVLTMVLTLLPLGAVAAEDGAEDPMALRNAAAEEAAGTTEPEVTEPETTEPETTEPGTTEPVTTEPETTEPETTEPETTEPETTEPETTEPAEEPAEEPEEEPEAAAVETDLFVDGVNTGLWKYENGGWTYYVGSTRLTGVQEIDGDIYYFKPENGVSQRGWITTGGKSYYFSQTDRKALKGLNYIGSTYYFFDEKTGEMCRNGMVIAEDGHRYYLGSNGVIQTGWKTVDGKTYYFGAGSKCALTGLWSLSTGTYFFDETTGELARSGLVVAGSGRRYYVDANGRVQTGWKTVDGKTYYFGSSSKYALTGLWELSSGTYYFDDVTGELPPAGLYIAKNGRRYCIDQNGRVQTGWKTIDGKTYYFGSSSKYALTGVWYLSSGTYFFDDVTGELPPAGLYTGKNGRIYCIGPSGALQHGWKTIDGKTYYFSYYYDYALTGMHYIGSSYYFFDETTGELCKAGLVLAKDGHRYCVDNDGRIQTGWKTIDGKTYYFGSSSKYALTGVWYLSSGTYFFDDVTGELPPAGLYTGKNGRTYCIGPSGALQYGWKTIDGKTYYFSYYYDYALTGVQYIGSSYYYFDENGVLGSAGLNKAANGRLYYLNDSGVVQTGWKTVDGKTYYFGANSKYALTGVWTLSGKTYYFDDNTCALAEAGWYTDKSGDTFYVKEDGSVAYGWTTIDGKTYYFSKNTRKVLKGVWQIGYYYYYFDDVTGELRTGLVEDSKGNKYYLDKDGVCLTGWRTIDGKTYYFGSSSKKALTGVWTLSGKTYYFDDKTAVLASAGWAIDQAGNRYYINENGTVTTGWKTIDGKTYYFGSTSKKALTGLWEISGENYIFDETGAMVSGYGQYTTPDGSVYFMNGTHPKTGWVTEGGKTYYYSPSDGQMCTGWQVIGAYMYYFYKQGEDGAYGTMAVNVDIDGRHLNEKGQTATAVQDRMDLLAQKYSSRTNYLIMLDTTNCKVGIYKLVNGSWSNIYFWNCICGKGDYSYHDTPTGLHTTYNTCYTFGTDYYTCYYGTAFYASSKYEYLFHSLLYYTHGGGLIPGQPLGTHISNGCVRLEWDNCKWIYYNIPYGTTVYSY